MSLDKVDSWRIGMRQHVVLGTCAQLPCSPCRRHANNVRDVSTSIAVIEAPEYEHRPINGPHEEFLTYSHVYSLTVSAG